MALAMEEGIDNELHKPQESTIMKKFLESEEMTLKQ
jgi:hypothetical protein